MDASVDLDSVLLPKRHILGSKQPPDIIGPEIILARLRSGAMGIPSYCDLALSTYDRLLGSNELGFVS